MYIDQVFVALLQHKEIKNSYASKLKGQVQDSPR